MAARTATAILSRLIYSVVLYLLTPVILLRLAWRGHKAPAYRRRWAERFGWIAPPAGPPPIWVHAVSVGEAQAALPMIRGLRQRHPEVPLVVTTTTPTGSDLVRERLGDAVYHCYLPYDLPDAVARFLRRVRPRLAVIMETELWPNLFRAASKRGIPLLLANARLSERSARGYRRFRPLIAGTLACVDTVAAQTAADAERFRRLGADGAAVRVLGNIKFDLDIPEKHRQEGAALRRALGPDRPVWIAASTHGGEEEKVLEAFERVRADVPDAVLILAPRHPERFAGVDELCRRRGFRVCRRSDNPLPNGETDIYLGDTMGELVAFYAAADAAFVGGSLVPVGGHNPLEPAALGVPVLSGPGFFNFQAITASMVEAGGARLVDDVRELAEAVAGMLQRRAEAETMGERGRSLVGRNRGALGMLLDLITERIGPAGIRRQHRAAEHAAAPRSGRMGQRSRRPRHVGTGAHRPVRPWRGRIDGVTPTDVRLVCRPGITGRSSPPSSSPRTRYTNGR